MPIRSNEFQHLITLIEGAIASQGAKVIPSAEITEPSSGAKREVDILIENNVGSHLIRIAIECRNHSRPADVSWIDSLKGKYRDLSIDKVIAVSKSGFTKQALKKAESLNIDALTLKQAEEAEWTSFLPQKTVTIDNFILPTLKSAKVMVVVEKGEDQPQFKQFPELHIVDDDTGQDLGCLPDIANQIIKAPDFVKSLEKKAVTDAKTCFKVTIEYSNKKFFVIAPNKQRFRLWALILEGFCRREICQLPVERLEYGETQIAHARQRLFGKTVDIVFTPQDQDMMQVSFGVTNSDKGKKKKRK